MRVIALPAWLAFAAGLFALDATSYFGHRLQHAIPPLWRLHAIHHSDPELDVTTTFRAHPLAALVDTAFITLAVIAFGIPASAVIAYRWLEVGIQSFAHANIALPAWMSVRVSSILVTPGFHRLHHSPEVIETNSNYGQVLSIWDRLFGTARVHGDGPERFGLRVFDAPKFQDLHWLLAQPVLRRAKASVSHEEVAAE